VCYAREFGLAINVVLFVLVSILQLGFARVQELKAKLSSTPILKQPIKNDHSNYILIGVL
jgi:hypothetical protein